MNRRFLKVAIALCLSLALFTKAGFAADPSDIVLTDSLKETELRIATILKDKMNVSGTLSIPGANSEDLVLRFTVNSSGPKALPPIQVVIDAPIIGRDAQGAVTSQLIGIASYADVKLTLDKHLEQLEWVNRFNSRNTPVRFYLTGNKIVVAWHLLITRKEPVTEDAFITALKSLLQSWPNLIDDMRSSEIIE